MNNKTIYVFYDVRKNPFEHPNQPPLAICFTEEAAKAMSSSLGGGSWPSYAITEEEYARLLVLANYKTS